MCLRKGPEGHLSKVHVNWYFLVLYWLRSTNTGNKISNWSYLPNVASLVLKTNKNTQERERERYRDRQTESAWDVCVCVCVCVRACVLDGEGNRVFASTAAEL